MLHGKECARRGGVGTTVGPAGPLHLRPHRRLWRPLKACDTDFLPVSTTQPLLLGIDPTALPDLSSAEGRRAEEEEAVGSRKGDTHWRVDETGVAPGSGHGGRRVPGRGVAGAKEVRLNFRGAGEAVGVIHVFCEEWERNRVREVPNSQSGIKAALTLSAQSACEDRAPGRPMCLHLFITQGYF